LETEIYGTVRGPAWWRETLVEQLKALGYEESHFDPCLYILRGNKAKQVRADRLQQRLRANPFEDSEWLVPKNVVGADKAAWLEPVEGLVLVEVDDLFEGGYERHQELMKDLTKTFKFGKHISVKQQEGGTFDGMRMTQQKDFGFFLSMKDYLLTRVREIPLTPLRKKQREQRITEQEFNQMRALTGSVLWAVRKRRPDAAGPINLFQRKGRDACVQDLVEANDLVKHLRETADLGIHVRPIKMERLRVCVHADASLNAVAGCKSQGATMVSLVDQDVVEERQAPRTWRRGTVEP
jgi:hypothetical protein